MHDRRYDPSTFHLTFFLHTGFFRNASHAVRIDFATDSNDRRLPQS